MITIQGHKYKVAMPELDEFTTAYIDAMLWSSYAYDDENEESVLMDELFGPEDIAPECLQRIIVDCTKFQEENFEAIESAEVTRPSDYSNFGAAGHDFWLTREGHGAGFWDGDWSEPEATQLTEAAEAFGGVHSLDAHASGEGQVTC